jgi:hypothetical protein
MNQDRTAKPSRWRRIVVALAGVGIISGSALALTAGSAMAEPINRADCSQYYLTYLQYDLWATVDFADWTTALAEENWERANSLSNLYGIDRDAADTYLAIYQALC